MQQQQQDIQTTTSFLVLWALPFWYKSLRGRVGATMCQLNFQWDTRHLSGSAGFFLFLVEALKRYGLELLDLREGKNMTTLLALSSAGG